MIKFQIRKQIHGLIFETAMGYLRRLLSHVPDAFSRFATTSYSKDEAFNRPLVTTFIVPKQHEYVQKIFVDALHGNQTSNCELEFRTKSGETCFLLVNTTTRRDSENNVIGVVGVAVTESNKNHLAVAAIANELRQLAKTANAPIFGMDVDGNVNEWNETTAARRSRTIARRNAVVSSEI